MQFCVTVCTVVCYWEHCCVNAASPAVCIVVQQCVPLSLLRYVSMSTRWRDAERWREVEGGVEEGWRMIEDDGVNGREVK